MTVQTFKTPFTASDEQLKEAGELIEGLNFTESYTCCDGYESWSSTRPNMDAFVELIARAREHYGN